MRAVILGAAEIHDYSVLEQNILPEDYIICADGGAFHAAKIGRTPDLLVGDFDSGGGEFEAAEVIRLPAEKDDTDTHFAAKTALERGFRKILLFGVTGGRTDHTLSNLCTLYYLTKNGAEAIIYSEKEKFLMVIDGEIILNPQKNAHVSVFPFGGDAEKVNERGMKFGLTDYHLRTEEPIGVSNEFCGCAAGGGEVTAADGDGDVVAGDGDGGIAAAVVSVEKGAVLVIITGM